MRHIFVCAALLLGLSGCEALRGVEVMSNLGIPGMALPTFGSDSGGQVYETHDCPCPPVDFDHKPATP